MSLGEQSKFLQNNHIFRQTVSSRDYGLFRVRKSVLKGSFPHSPDGTIKKRVYQREKFENLVEKFRRTDRIFRGFEGYQSYGCPKDYLPLLSPLFHITDPNNSDKKVILRSTYVTQILGI